MYNQKVCNKCACIDGKYELGAVGEMNFNCEDCGEPTDWCYEVQLKPAPTCEYCENVATETFHDDEIGTVKVCEHCEYRLLDAFTPNNIVPTYKAFMQSCVEGESI